MFTTKKRKFGPEKSSRPAGQRCFLKMAFVLYLYLETMSGDADFHCAMFFILAGCKTFDSIFFLPNHNHSVSYGQSHAIDPLPNSRGLDFSLAVQHTVTHY